MIANLWNSLFREVRLEPTCPVVVTIRILSCANISASLTLIENQMSDFYVEKPFDACRNQDV